MVKIKRNEDFIKPILHKLNKFSVEMLVKVCSHIVPSHIKFQAVLLWLRWLVWYLHFISFRRTDKLSVFFLKCEHIIIHSFVKKDRQNQAFDVFLKPKLWSLQLCIILTILNFRNMTPLDQMGHIYIIMYIRYKILLHNMW